MPIARGTAHRHLPRPDPGHRHDPADDRLLCGREESSRAIPERFGAARSRASPGRRPTNNAYANGALIPLFTLGIPASPTIAVLLGAFMMNGLHAGAVPVPDKPDFVWARHRQPLCRQRDPADPQPAAGRHVGAAAEGPVLDPVPARARLHRRRRLRHPQQHVRRRRADRASASSATCCKKIDFPVAPMAFTLILGPLDREGAAPGAVDVGREPRHPHAELSRTALLVASGLILLTPLVSWLWRRVRSA